MMITHILEILQSLEAPATVDNIEQLRSGWEANLYAYTRTTDLGQKERRVIRIFPGGGDDAKALREFQAMRHLSEQGYAVPRAHYHASANESALGLPFLLIDFIEGTLFGDSHMFQGTADQQAHTMHQFATLHHQLHTLAWPDVIEIPFAPNDPYGFIRGRLAGYHATGDELMPSDVIVMLDWLDARQASVPCHQYALVHNDFHPWNILVNTKGELTVLDWSSFAVSDPREDIAAAWLLLDGYAGANHSQAYLEAYQAVHQTPLEEISYFIALACLRRLGSMLISMSGNADQVGMRPGVEEEMRSSLHGMAFRRAYQAWQKITTLDSPTIDAVLSQMGA